jgi:hypothetical protein
MQHLTCYSSCWVASPMIYGESSEPDCESLYCQNMLSTALLQKAVHTFGTCLLCWSHKATWPVDTTRGIPSGAAGNAGALRYFTRDVIYCYIWRYNDKSLCERLGSHSLVYVVLCLLGCTLCWSGNSYTCFGGSSSGWEQLNVHRLSGVDCFNPENGGSKIIWNISDYLLFDMASYPRWLEPLIESYETHSKFLFNMLLDKCEIKLKIIKR